MVLLQKNPPLTDILQLDTPSASKPVSVSQSRASQPQSISDSLTASKLVASLLACGLGEQQISAISGLQPSEVRGYRDQDSVAHLVNQIHSMMGLSAEQRIARSIQTVIDKKLRLLQVSKDEKLVDKVGTELLERQFGKAVQTTQSISVSLQGSTTLDELVHKQKAVDERLAKLSADKQKLLRSTTQKSEPVDV